MMAKGLVSGATPPEKLHRDDLDVAVRADASSDRDVDKKKKVDGDKSAADAAIDANAAKRMGTLARLPIARGQVGPLPGDIRGDLENAVGMSLAGVTVHADDRGLAVAASHGARAVAIGSDIFVGKGMLGADAAEQKALLAHEVAHVAQSRGATGNAKAARGAGTEAAEDEANQFATTFAEKGGAAKWQPTMAVSAGTAMHAPEADVTKKPAGEKPDVAWAYLRRNEAAFVAAMAEHIRLVPLVTDPRLGWIPGGMATQFPAALKIALEGKPLFLRLQELVFPRDPWLSIDLHRHLASGTPGETFDGREPEGAMEFEFLAGGAVATDVQKALLLSMQRMLPRYIVQLESKPVITVPDLVTSHPMDVVMANLLCDPLVLKGIPPVKDQQKGHGKPGAHEAKAPDDPRQFKEGVRFLQNWRWLGEKDQKLWNWVEALDPVDATPEEVAATLWMDLSATKHAYQITQSGRFFRLEAPLARNFVKDPFEKIDGPDRDNALDLADSDLATEAAISQAADDKRLDKKGHDLPADFKELGRTLKRSERQLTRAKDLLPDPVWEKVLPALHWVHKQADYLGEMNDKHLADLTPVIEGQSDILFEAVGAIAEVSNTADVKLLADDPNSPITKVLREFATAAGESHLVDSARLHMARARAARADLPLALLDISARATSEGVDDFAAQTNGDWAGDHAMKIDNNRRVIDDLRRRQANGEKIDETLVAYTAAQVKEQAVDVRTKSLHNQLSDLANLARDSKFGFFETMATAFDSDIRGLPGVIYGVMEDLKTSVIDMHTLIKADDLANAKTDGDRTIILENATRRTEKNLADFVARNQLEKRMKAAYAIIEKQERRTTIIKVVTQILILIGTSVVGGMVGNVVAGMVRGAMIADAATASIGMLRATRFVGAVAGLTVDAGINAGVQLAVQGGDAKEAFIGNFLGSAAVRIALAPLTRAAQAWGIAGEEAKNLEKLSVWSKVQRGGKVVLYEGAVLTTSMITAAATDYVVHRIYHSDEPPTEKQALDWAIQGGSMAIGSFVGKWAHGFESRLVQMAEHQGQLWARAQKMKALSVELSKAGSEDLALDLLVKRQEALDEESKLLDDLETRMRKDPKSVQLSRETLNTLRVGNHAEAGAVKDAAFDMVPLRLGGLAPDDASGTTWTGHPAQIEAALDKSRRAGIDVEVISHDAAKNQWKVRYNNKDITIIETQQKSAVVMSGNDTELADAAANIKPLAGYQDVVVHGTVDDFEVVVNGKVVSLDHRSLATYIKKNGGGNKKIRLLSCETGKHAKGAAQHLANKLGVEVMAPNDLLHVFEDGSMVIGPKSDRNTGSWETFTPKKSERRFSAHKESAPERAIDRLHRQRAELATDENGAKTLGLGGDDATERLPLHEKTNLDDAKVAGEDRAAKAAAEIGGNYEELARDVAIKSVASDIQVESGLRVLDNAFGKSTSDAFKNAAKDVAGHPDGPAKEADTAALDTANSDRLRLQKEMLDVMRNPSLDINTRKAKLKSLLAQFEAVAHGAPKVKSEKIKFQAAHDAIDALKAETFSNMLAVDAAGNMSQGGKSAGTLSDLMASVQVTNAAYKRHGIPEEFVIAISTPNDPAVPREVKILSRKPRGPDEVALDVKPQKHDAVDPSDQNDDGLVVDIGVGLTDYAREVGGETGDVVKSEYGPSYTDPAMQRRDLTWQHTAPRVDADSVVVLGDTLQTLGMMFPKKSVKRMFINNINAYYGADDYANLAKGLRDVMADGGRVEVQWTTAPETTGGVTKDRGHIKGEGLRQALDATAASSPRAFQVNENAPPVTDYDYSVEAPRSMDGKAGREKPTNPVPEFRWVFTFGS